MAGTLKVGVILLLILSIQSVNGLVIMGYSAGSDNSPIEITIGAKTLFIAGKMVRYFEKILSQYFSRGSPRGKQKSI